VFGAFGLITIAGPGGHIYTLKEIKSQLDTALTNLTTDEQTQFTQTGDPSGILERFDLEWLEYSRVGSAGGSQGLLYNAEIAMQTLRENAALILGFFVPPGGFIAEFNRAIGAGVRGAGVVR